MANFMASRMTHPTRKPIFSLLLLTCVAVYAIIQTGCRKEKFLNSGGEIRFSTDTLTFDTVFTSLGSFTLSMKIYNPQNERISIGSLQMEGGAASPFHLNVDGHKGPIVRNLELAPNDSAYVFATVNIDPTNENSPFVVEDKLVATMNGKTYRVPFMAYGQNAHYIVDSVIDQPGTVTWGTDKPYVIIHSALIDEGTTLNIQPGCRIYMHADSRLLVDGTLKAIGTKKDSIVFQGDRLDRRYFGFEGYPGEWGGLYFTSASTNNELTYVILKNGGNSALGAPPALVQVNPDSVTGSLQLKMDRVTIENSIGYGLLSFGGEVMADNCLMHSCGAYALALVQGGKYVLNNCTIAVYGNDKINHTENPAAILLNYFKQSDTQWNPNAMDAVLNNCVIWGSLQNELVIDSISAAPCTVTMNNCIAKAETAKVPVWVKKNNVRFNADPLFVDYNKWNYRPKSGSPVIDAGLTNIPGVGARDLDDAARNAPWDIGAYEFR